jgi:hypothetical protein
MIPIEHLLMQRLCGIMVATDDLAAIAARIASAGHELIIQVDGTAYAMVEDAVDEILQDMEVELVTISTSDRGERALDFTYRPHAVVLETASTHAHDRKAFLVIAELLATRPLSGSSLCDIVSALPERTQRPFLLASIGRLWKPTSASRPAPSDSRRLRASAASPSSGRHPPP